MHLFTVSLNKWPHNTVEAKLQRWSWIFSSQGVFGNQTCKRNFQPFSAANTTFKKPLLLRLQHRQRDYGKQDECVERLSWAFEAYQDLQHKGEPLGIPSGLEWSLVDASQSPEQVLEEVYALLKSHCPKAWLWKQHMFHVESVFVLNISNNILCNINNK